PTPAEVGEHRLEVDRMDVGEGRKKAKTPFKDGRRSGRPVRRQARGDEPRVRRRASVHGLGLRTVGEILEDAAGEAAGNAERLPDRRTFEPAKPGRPRGRAE